MHFWDENVEICIWRAISKFLSIKVLERNNFGQILIWPKILTEILKILTETFLTEINLTETFLTETFVN